MVVGIDSVRRVARVKNWVREKSTIQEIKIRIGRNGADVGLDRGEPRLGLALVIGVRRGRYVLWWRGRERERGRRRRRKGWRSF